VGWIRGDQAIDPKVLQDTERLRIENAELRDRLSELEMNRIHFPSNIAGPDTTLDMPIFTTRVAEGKRIAERLMIANVAICDIFTDSFEVLLGNVGETLLKRHIAKIIIRRKINNVEEHLRQRLKDKNIDIVIQDSDIRLLRFHLEALGLIKTGTMGREVSWTITDMGRRYVTMKKALPSIE
jgi:hypothetical protein